MPPLPSLKGQPTDEHFFTSAPVRLSDTFAIARPASAVWAELTADNTLSWCRIIDRIEWTSARPFGVGTTRQVKALKGANVMNEYYFRWEEGRRMSFYAVDSTAPMFRRFAEDYLVEPAGDDACRFTWSVAYEPRRGFGFTAPVNKRLLGTLFTDTRKHYAA